MVKILLIEDEKAVRLLTKAKLKDKYEILEAANGEEALDVMDSVKVDLIIADIMMPEMNGYEFVEELRASGDVTPVIMLTAMNTFEHKKKGFSLGIDDYLTKPINYEELEWHIEAILRRVKISSDKEIVVGEFCLSEETKAALYKDEVIDLTDIEFKLIHKFLSYPSVIFTKQQIMDDVWGYDSDSDYNTIKTYINRLRNKFADCSEFEIVSVRGVGYKVVLNQKEV